MDNMQMKNVMFGLLLSAAGCGSSNDESGTTESLKAPTNLKAEPLDGATHLTWTDNSNEAEFMIERKSGSSDWTTIGTVPFDTTQYHDANLDSTMTYTYRVMPMGKDGQHGPASSEASCMPHAGAAAGHAAH